MPPDMPVFHIHQILTHYTRREDLDPGFLVLDNSSNERPDWYEYWPMRRFLMREPMDESAFYGFLSPKFRVKTNLSAAQVREFIERSPEADVYLFSPSIHNSAYFWNVFEHGEFEHPGLAGVAARFLARIDPSATHRCARLGLAQHRALELLRGETALLAGVARGQRAAVRHRRDAGR